MTSAVVIGNGESRKQVDISLLRKDNILVGCNAIHRELDVDHLVCVDRRMIDESLANPKTQFTTIYVRENWFEYYKDTRNNQNIKAVPTLPFPITQRADEPFHWGSGGYAVMVAVELGCNKITLLGFDLYGIDNKVNNVYKDTPNYQPADSRAVDPSYWIYQIGLIFKYFPEIEFEIVNRQDWSMPEQWKYPNVKFKSLTVDI